MNEASEVNSRALEDNLERINALIQRLIVAMHNKRMHNPKLDAPDQHFFSKTSAALMTEMLSDPSKILSTQMQFWSESVRNFLDLQAQMLRSSDDQPESTPAPVTKDRRFSHPLWQSHPYFRLVLKQYQTTAQALEKMVGEAEHLSPKDQEKLRFFTRQYLDLIAPSNYLATNPDALERAVETNGQSLLEGLENFVKDFEANPNGLAVNLTDTEAFKIGVNIATAPGGVVYRNSLFELLQFKATTEEVYQTPIVIFPPWINKYYILDLSPQNSLIRYLVDKGHTVFVVSWVNPDPSHSALGLSDYLKDGLLTAIDQVLAITGTKKVNAVGYCIAGTLLTCALAYLAQTDRDIINKASFFTAMTDFAEPGELGSFIEDGFLEGIRAEVTENGILDGFFMSRAFSFLRSSDLVYTPAVKSYMMGEKPKAFDLLFWNSDSTNMPATMSLEYLENLYRDNELARGVFHLMGKALNIADITTPIFLVATQTDHIAPWQSCFHGLSRCSGPKTFVLSESGHIAGIINPPARNKYGHWVNPANYGDPEVWMAGASYHPASWWDRWREWLEEGAEARVKAPDLGSAEFPVIEPAPGSYVKVSFKDVPHRAASSGTQPE